MRMLLGPFFLIFFLRELGSELGTQFFPILSKMWFLQISLDYRDVILRSYHPYVSVDESSMLRCCPPSGQRSEAVLDAR